jgi:hypothetical protein
MKEFFMAATVTLVAALPSTTNYKLNSYGFGSGGVANSSTATYSLEGSSGELSSGNLGVGNYGVKPGYVQTQQANVPKLASIDNNGGLYYNRLHFVLDNQNNPNDATFLVAVSTDNFASNLTYVQPDGTLTSTLSLADYQTYAAWGSSSGSLIIGLLPGTTYYVKVRATQGQFSESAYGPVSTQATANSTISFDLQTSTQSTPPFSVDLGTLTAGSITASSQTINTTFSTNAASGGGVYIAGQNSGLLSSLTGHRIDAVSTDLTGATNGFGAQNYSISQSSGGPYSVVTPYDGTGNTVGIINNTSRSLYNAAAPVTNGAGILKLLAKSSTNDIAASDYTEVLTFTAAANF